MNDVISPATGHARRILVVDDDPTIALVVRLALQKDGHQPEVFSSAMAAWTRLAAEQNGYDLLILDQNMPDIGGVEIARRIRAAGQSVPILLMGGDLDKLDGSLGDNTSQLKKPFDVFELLAVVRAIFEQVSRKTGVAAKSQQTL